jgi:hypothetical protein
MGSRANVKISPLPRGKERSQNGSVPANEPSESVGPPGPVPHKAGQPQAHAMTRAPFSMAAMLCLQAEEPPAALMATKTVLTEVVAYLRFSTPGTFAPRSCLIPTYALRGFAIFGSLGIMISGLGATVPERRRHEIVTLGIRSILPGTLATRVCGAPAGMLA